MKHQNNKGNFYQIVEGSREEGAPIIKKAIELEWRVLKTVVM